MIGTAFRLTHRGWAGTGGWPCSCPMEDRRMKLLEVCQWQVCWGLISEHLSLFRWGGASLKATLSGQKGSVGGLHTSLGKRWTQRHRQGTAMKTSTDGARKGLGKGIQPLQVFPNLWSQDSLGWLLLTAAPHWGPQSETCPVVRGQQSQK